MGMKQSDSIHLPINDIIPDIKRQLATANTLVVSAPPGAGKSTLLPLALLGEPWLKEKKIVMLEPRRLAAGAIAQRMAALLQEPVGRTVGYRIRFESKISGLTRLEVVTEGILTRMLQQDNALEEVGLVIFDEFHERSIHADIALALCRDAQQILRPDLRIMIMSATLNMSPLSQILNAPVVESKGSLYPVEIIYTGEQDPSKIAELCALTIIRALREKDGDILAFLPGVGEIKKCETLLKKNVGGAIVYPLYGQLSYAEQVAAILPDPASRRKIVLSTSIAETSLTIEGIKIVVDSGFSRVPFFDSKTNLSGLRTLPISADSADQRAGRAGRLSSGVCYRMWSVATQQRLLPFRTPEILSSDLAPLVLDMLEWGVSDISRMTWLTPPPPEALSFALESLTALKAIHNGRITPHGKQIHRLPCHPRLAHMLVMASVEETTCLAADLAALLGERDPMETSGDVDIVLRIEALRRHRRERRTDRRWDTIEKGASLYRRLFAVEEENGPVDPYLTGRLVAYAYPERIAKARDTHPGQFQLANGRAALVSETSDLSHESWLAIAHLDDRKGLGKVFLAAPIRPEDVLPSAVETQLVTWDQRKGGLLAVRELRVGNLVVQSQPLRKPEDALVNRAIAEVLEREGETLLDFSEEVRHWQNRVMSLRVWNGNGEWPDVSTEFLTKNSRKWLEPYFSMIRRNEDFRKINLIQVLQQYLGYDKQLLLDRLAPTSVKVPSGSLIRIKYYGDGQTPVLEVRLQEVFGMTDTPRINGGKKPLVLHLLSPGFKPVQVTTDLRSFWNNTYFEVKKELKRRYPKHSWPDNPLQAEAVRGVRRVKGS